MKKLLLISMIILILSPYIVLAKRGGGEQGVEETGLKPRGKYDFNTEGYLSEIENEYFFFNDQKIIYEQSDFEAFDSLGRAVHFSSVEPPAYAKLVLSEEEGKLVATAIKIIFYPALDDLGGRRSVNSLRKIHNSATYNLDENRITEYGQDGPPAIRGQGQRDDDADDSETGNDAQGSGLQIERQ